MRSRNRTLAAGLLLLLAHPVNADNPPPQLGPLPFSAFDTDRSGDISREEFETLHKQRAVSASIPGQPRLQAPSFSDFDRDADGNLTYDEFIQGQRQRMQQRSPGYADPPVNPGMGPGMGSGMRRQMPTFADFDLNADGVIHEEEFSQARAKRIEARLMAGYPMRNLKNAQPFSEIDTNGDGALNPEEFAAAQQRHRMPMTP
ncbi:MAG: EF-hand domain-containing protein [Candidatus Thiodiazotropha sp.]